MGCGAATVKYIMLITNFVFALAGLILLGLGVAAHLASLTEGSAKYAPIGIMMVGGIVFVIAFFGCCGAIKESNCMLVTYSIFMLFLMVVKLTLAILMFVNLDKWLAEIPGGLNKVFAMDQTAFHTIEKTFQCCGPNGSLSYMNLILPESCCAWPPCVVGNTYPGCSAKVESFFSTFGTAIGSVLIVVVAIELLAVVFGLCLASHARNKSRGSRCGTY